MKKQLLFVYCIFVFILLLAIPSISAKQQSINKLDLMEKTNLNEDVKLPNLYKYISSWLFIRYYRATILIFFSTEWDFENLEQIILKPIIFYRGSWLKYTTVEIGVYFQKLSDKFGWNWELPV